MGETISEYLKRLRDKYTIDDMKSQLLAKLHGWLVQKESKGFGNSQVNNKEMENLIKKYL